MRKSGSIALVIGIAYASLAHADHQPVIAIPGKPGVPVVINGLDASYAMVEGDWGLSRPGAMAPTVYYTTPPVPLTPATLDYYGNPLRGYFPRTGKPPKLGRKEINPPANRVLPPPAQPYHRSWSTGSAALPAQVDPVYPPVMPPVIVEPRVRRRY